MSTPRNKDIAGVTFAVADVEPSRVKRLTVPYHDIIEGHVNSRGKLEAFSRESSPLVSTPRNRTADLGHGFINALNMAYDQHHPLVLSPDVIWLLIAQGVSLHVRELSESLREKFVNHSGKLKIIVRRDEFVRGFEGNDWEGVFSEFSTAIRGHIREEMHRLVVREFSTTGPVERAAVEVTLLDAMQNYFEYTLMTKCGIPSITLLGSTEDWLQVREGAKAIADLGLNWWLESIVPVLDQFVAASRQEVDHTFWRNLYKRDDMSGGPQITGHAINFFPYLVEEDGPQSRNPYLGRHSFDMGEGLTTDELSTGLSTAPFKWDYYGTEIPMEFIAGFVGVRQDEDTLALRPEIGWAVVEKRDTGQTVA